MGNKLYAVSFFYREGRVVGHSLWLPDITYALGTRCLFACANATRHVLTWERHAVHGNTLDIRSKVMGPFSRQLPGLSVGLFCVMFGILWHEMALQKAPWVINTQGQRFGWLSNWIWTEKQHPTFGFYKAILEHVVWPNFTFFGYLTFFVEMALGVSLLLGVL